MFPYPISFLKSSATANPDCIMEWTIAALGDAAARTITLFGHTGTTLNNYDVDWGDGTAIETGITTVDKTHEYASDASIQTYVVTITDQFGGLRMQRSPQANRDKLTKFVNWGTSQINGVYGMFMGCSNMLYEATDSPDLTSLIAQYGDLLTNAFYNCSSIVGLDLSGWSNVDSFTQMYETFRGTDNLATLNLSGWNLANVTTMFRCFYGTGNVVGCDFNLSNINLPICTTGQLFRTACKFSVDPNFTNFDLSGFTNMITFFVNSDGAVDIDLSTVDFTSAITSFNSFAANSEATSFTFGSGSDFSGITTYSSAFSACPNLETVTFPPLTDFSSCTDLYRVFYNCSNMSTIDLGTIQDFGLVTNWQTFRGLGDCSINFLTTTNIQSTTALNNLLYQTKIETAQYDKLLQALVTAGNSSGNLGAGTSTYTASPGAGGVARAALVTAGWTITDGGAA
jgi:surface protein